MTPLGWYTTPRRLTGAAAVFCRAVSAGTMASSSGSATVVPRPRSTVRRDRALRVTIMRTTSSPRSPHLERRALHDRQNRRRPPVVVGGGRPHDTANRRCVEVFHLPAQGVGEE